MHPFWPSHWVSSGVGAENRGFNDLVRRYQLLSIGPAAGRGWSDAFTFFVSGLIHDLVISYPPGRVTGSPRPISSCKAWRSLGKIAARPPARSAPWGGGRLFVYLFTVGPVGMLFFPRFVEGVVLPFLKFIHAL